MAYLVKSINLNNTGADVVCNLRLFKNRKTAEKYMKLVAKQIPEDSDSEWLEIEELITWIGTNI